jgi:hypothetical protein
VEHPFRTSTLEPLRRRLDNSGSKENVWIPELVRIFLKGSNVHPGFKDHDIAAFVHAWLTVRQAKQIAEDAVEVCAHSGVSTHLYLMTPNVRVERAARNRSSAPQA